MVVLHMKNVDLFALVPLKMSDIYTRVVYHRLAIDTTIKLVSQRKCKVSEEKIVVIDEEVQKLTSANFIRETLQNGKRF